MLVARSWLLQPFFADLVGLADGMAGLLMSRIGAGDIRMRRWHGGQLSTDLWVQSCFAGNFGERNLAIASDNISYVGHVHIAGAVAPRPGLACCKHHIRALGKALLHVYVPHEVARYVGLMAMPTGACKKALLRLVWEVIADWRDQQAHCLVGTREACMAQ